MYFQRQIKKSIQSKLFTSGRILIIYWPRRTGKTTLVKELIDAYKATKRTKYIQCESAVAQEGFSGRNPVLLKQYIGDVQLLVLDEAQYISEIGVNLKLLIDTYPDIQIVVTGSSSLDLAGKIKEPLTGRIFEYMLSPITLSEAETAYGKENIDSYLENYLLYGMYPSVLNAAGDEKKDVLQ